MADEIQEAFRRLYGLSCWGVDWDVDTGLSMNFGAPHLHVREPKPDQSPSEAMRPWRMSMYRHVCVRGEWRFWITGAFWNLTLRDIPPVRGTATWRRIQRGITRLDGQKLERMTVDPATARTHFEFDLGAVLEVRRLSRQEDSDLWTLYTPDEHALSVRGSGEFHYDLATGHNVLWKPIVSSRGGHSSTTSNAV